MFFQPQSINLADLAKSCGGEIVGNNSTEVIINGASPIEEASAGHISFASAVICSEKHLSNVSDKLSAIVHPKPYEAYGLVLAQLYPTATRPQPITGIEGISDKAIIMDGCTIEDDVTIEAGAVVGKGASIGNGSVILSGAMIGQGVQIGRNTTIGANATVTNAYIGDRVIIHNGVQIGQDGFGFAMGPGGHHKVPQIGRVIIQDKVEIGANTTIDRGANRDTVIGEGTKIDNLVQIGHNVTIGCHCVIVGLAGVSGSATLGDYVVVAGQAGIVGHTKVGSGAQVGGGSGVHGDVAPGDRVMGYPAVQASRWMRQAAKEMLADKKAKKNKGA